MATISYSLENQLKLLSNNLGPFIIVAKGHSGTRFLAKAMLANNIFMGSNLNSMLDSMSWFEEFGYPLIISKYFPDWHNYYRDDSFHSFLDGTMLKTLMRYTASYRGGPWGWKGSTLFHMPLIKKYFENAKFIHIIRDGRDLVLSDQGSLNLPFNIPLLSRNPFTLFRRLMQIPRRRIENKYRMRVVFGDSEIKEWRGIKMNKKSAFNNKYQIQMQSWIHNVTVAIKYGKKMPHSYYEVRYEDLCLQPLETIRKVFEFCEIPIIDETIEFVQKNARTGSIGKWRKININETELADFNNAVRLGNNLLNELGYL